MLLQALYIISKPSVNSNWSDSQETLNSTQNQRYLSLLTFKFHRWPWKTIGHLFYATSRFEHHFIAICEFELAIFFTGLRWQKMISPSNWAFLKNHCIWTTIQASVVSFKRQNYFLSLCWQKITFLSNFEQKKNACSRMANCGSGLPAEWPFHSQNAIEASDSPLPGGLWVKRLITHALCSLAYSDIAWCKLFLILTMKVLYWVLFAYKTPYSVLSD